MRAELTGTAAVLRATVKHDGRHFVRWILLATALPASSVAIYPFVFPTEIDRVRLAVAIGSNPALGLIFGRASDLASVDGFTAWRSLALGSFLAALGAILTVTKATRHQEDSGQAELLASSVLGRSSRLLVATGMAFGGSVLLGLVAGLVTFSLGGAWESSLLLGATYAAAGWMFAGVAAVSAQIASDSRTANSMAVGTLGALFMMRGLADSMDAPEWTLWINPLGWLQETRPATDSQWWPLALAAVLAAGLLLTAFSLQARRDFGLGLITPRPGRARGRQRNTWRLALLLNRANLITWTVALLGLGVAFGYFTSSVKDILGSDSGLRQVMAAGAITQADLISAFLATILSLTGIIAAVPGVQTIVRIRTEELEYRLEPIIATAISRPRYLASNVCAALGASSVLLMLAGTVIAVIASTADVGITFADAFLQAAVTVPAVWTVVALSVAVIGARPHVALVAWAGVVASFGLTLLGPTFGLDDWVLGISPFWHVPHAAATNPDPTGLPWVTLATLLFLVAGFSGFRRRDLAV